jgi:hypothetical protein
MPVLIDAMRALSALNVALLVGLGYVWGRNFFRFRSKHTLGLLVFAILLGIENAMSVYYFVFEAQLAAWITDPAAVPPPAQRVLLALRALEFAGIVFLTWVTWD